ncbi:MAG: DUF4390 domain-containing protein [Gammaproteobacteria bacterium]
MKNRHGNPYLLTLLMFMIGLMCFGVARGENSNGEFTVRSAETELVDKVYRLDARIDYQPSDRMLDALHKGIPLTIAMDIEVWRKRQYLWNEQIADVTQRYQLSYHALTRQYQIKNLNTGIQNSFPTLRAALDVLGAVDDFPMLDQQLLRAGDTYEARLRARLDIEALPVPIRLLAYIYAGWRVSSEWYTWPLRL